MVQEHAQPTHVTFDDIAAYIDGELAASREMELEMHFGSCPECTSELNDQKQLLRGLDLSFKAEAELQLPPDFAKIVAANAESTVAGLRRPRERFNALFICLGLGLFGLIGLGISPARSFGILSTTIVQLQAVVEFIGRLFYSFAVGLAVIVRTITSQFQADIASALLLTFVVALFVLMSRKALQRTFRF
ncbi:MAG TPA: zf-HC2 domain-containing protein [Pyrinomonadaceae bacterium]|jgi:hypothetical protein|nr:zf-HC2 domain-containing protein [Pyrinomonadaceae bacterium]